MSKNVSVNINEDYIKLDSLLKLSRQVVSGGEAKILIKSEKVKLNGEICTMRGKKIYPGDRVSVGECVVEVLKA